jgi:hypothetical protein
MTSSTRQILRSNFPFALEKNEGLFMNISRKTLEIKKGRIYPPFLPSTGFAKPYISCPAPCFRNLAANHSHISEEETSRAGQCAAQRAICASRRHEEGRIVDERSARGGEDGDTMAGVDCLADVVISEEVVVLGDCA